MTSRCATAVGQKPLFLLCWKRRFNSYIWITFKWFWLLSGFSLRLKLGLISVLTLRSTDHIYISLAYSIYACMYQCEPADFNFLQFVNTSVKIWTLILFINTNLWSCFTHSEWKLEDFLICWFFAAESYNALDSKISLKFLCR